MSRIQNLVLAAGTALNHLSDDPVVLALQISRRLPTSIVMPAAKLMIRTFPHSTATHSMLASFVTGDIDALEVKLSDALTRDISANRARLAADVALAAGRPDWADQFLPLAKPSKRFPATEARREWYSGNMESAIAALAGQRGAMKRHRERLAGEQRTFSGWTPELPSTPMAPIRGRVLHLLTNSLPHTSSGYAQRSHSIMLAQQQAGREVLAVTRLGYPVQVGKVLAAGEDIIDGVCYRRMIPSNLARTPDARMQQEAEALLKIVVEFRPEILHTTTHFANGLVVNAVAKAANIPWVYEVRGQLADTWASTRGESAKNSERYQLFQAAEARVMQDADAVVTLGETMLAGIVAQGISSEKVILGPNAVGGDFLAEPGTPEAAREKLGLDPSLNYIGTVSSLVDYEGLDHLVDAFSLLAPQFPKLRLLIVGGGTAGPALRDQAAKLGLSDRVIFTGRVAREVTSEYHQSMDIFVVSRKDLDVTKAVTPLKPVEALASARPVVASDLPALREIVTPGENGMLSPANNPKALASTLAILLRDETLRQRLGASGRQSVLKNRTWAANAQRYAERYEELINHQTRKEVIG
ncbi:glycosyltransferase WbuB [Arthrobacter psychrolactophilus]|uniref:D-inositol 3-phosphate glycosyltransferase n=1 Tax=Arthrobacter psychrolactophilus TaxID=92442 RepID=A0A2V5ISS3_9MICC|nr:glycosyltransferase family 4 protein [Arthrobacter psychrolactophilus]PYI39599.1 glycosyltransferase WbuB [Arthrobacter psychrolactophilus]